MAQQGGQCFYVIAGGGQGLGPPFFRKSEHRLHGVAAEQKVRQCIAGGQAVEKELSILSKLNPDVLLMLAKLGSSFEGVLPAGKCERVPGFESVEDIARWAKDAVTILTCGAPS